MSQFHLGVIKNYLVETFNDKIDLKDYEGKSEHDRTNAFLTRSVAAYTMMALCDITADEAGASVTDGFGDNGIDGLYYNQKENLLFLVQSKWRNDGTGSVDRGEIQKFLLGVRDIIVPRFDRFNEKINKRSTEIDQALRNANTNFMLVLAYTGQSDLSTEVEKDIQTFLEELNDSSDFVTFKTLKQSNLYHMIAKGAQGDPIKVDVAISNWGSIEEPNKAYYGQVAASDIAQWWEEYYPRLFSPNIRMFLGDTDVNDNIVNTLKNEPEKFWYYNNGITALCSTIKKKPLGGATREYGIFEVEDLKIVNGAQTAGAIAKAARSNTENVEKAVVNIRFIQLKDSPEVFEREITRNTNTQNRIEKRDFVALDPEQERIKDELKLHGINYVYKSGEIASSNEENFDIVEATVARACNQLEIDLAVQAKREIGKLWDNIEKAPYKKLFNASVNSLELWKQVQILRAVEEGLSEKDYAGRERLYAIHGNRFVANLVFRELYEILAKEQSSMITEEQLNLIKDKTQNILQDLIIIAEEKYPEAMLASLFKNLSKCKEIHTEYVKRQNAQ
ncbi:AIPR family protein [Schinkia azotoformans]|uniref:AIPR family protein n=1 Tax=Schinkia azotoformans TaxID=1454 RepID=UPI002DB95396|nr:AIPR family protein [Schinkia azotoformans]MEC1771961.1 AIPR family protein [Schinkia azotoformans]MED4366459.1 AIPR family protein [Schinkia azotoformans]